MKGIQPVWNNLIFIVSAPSGAGKTTLCDKLQKEFKDIHYAITATTRQPRGDEIDGKSYYFLTMEKFESMLAEGGFIEHALVHGNRYGSPKAPAVAALEEGCDVLMNVDVQGAAAIREYIRNAPDGKIVVGLHPRSFDDAAWRKLSSDVCGIFRKFGGTAEEQGPYAGWKFDPDSKLLAAARSRNVSVVFMVRILPAPCK